MNLITLQTNISNNYETNLENLKQLIIDASDDSIILAPELALTGYSYHNIDEAANFTTKAIEEIKKLSQNKSIALTMITKEDENYFNTFFLISDKEIVHQQSKNKLFTLNDEEVYFCAKGEHHINIFEHKGIKIGVLICFELRFIELWQNLRGADLILVPAMWGSQRKENFITLSNALATINQCYVMSSSPTNEEFSANSAIISPNGEALRDNSKKVITSSFDFNEIKKIRRVLYTGLRP